MLQRHAALGWRPRWHGTRFLALVWSASPLALAFLSPSSPRNQTGSGAQTHATLDSRQQKYGGLETPMPGTQTEYAGSLDLGEIGRARNTMMSIKLDQASDSVTGQTVVDPKGMLTDLNSTLPQSGAAIGSVAGMRPGAAFAGERGGLKRRGRALLLSLIESFSSFFLQ